MARPAREVQLTATIVSVAYTAALYLSGVHIQAGVKQGLSYLPAALVFLLILWDVWLWRQPVVQRFGPRPWIEGLWATTLTPTADSHIPDGGNLGPIEAYIVVRQTFWSIAVRQYTAESRSDSRGFMWVEGSAGSERILTYTYTNRPRQEVENRSRTHFGTAALDVVGLRPAVLNGDYFTDRYTKGDMRLLLIERGTNYADFDQARARAQLQPPG